LRDETSRPLIDVLLVLLVIFIGGPAVDQRRGRGYQPSPAENEDKAAAGRRSDRSDIVLEYSADRKDFDQPQRRHLGPELEGKLRDIFEARKVKTMFHPGR